MLITTTPILEGHPIKEYKGAVTVETIIAANVLRDIAASFSDFFGGRSGSYEKVIREAKETSMRELEAKAAAMGANAIVGFAIDYETMGKGASLLMAAARGTAVVI